MGSNLKRLVTAALALIMIVIAVLGIVIFIVFRKRPVQPLTILHTVAGVGGTYGSQPFGETFGLVVSPKGVIYVSDGQKGVIWQIATDGKATPLTEHLGTPSGIALATDGTLIVADSGAHTILKIDPANGESKILAGGPNQSGFADGDAASARFNAPVGVAVGPDGTVFVADTYNDRIRAIDKSGTVRTVAGGDTPGFADGDAQTSRFDTPGGIAVAPDGALIVADTGNRRIRRVDANDSVSTVAGSGEYGDRDGLLLEATFAEPIGVAVDMAGSIYVADAATDTIRVCQTKLLPVVVTMAGSRWQGLADGPATAGKLNRPSGVTLAPNGTVMIADTGNRLVRALISPDRNAGQETSAAEAKAMRPEATAFRQAAPGRWPYEPGDRAREIAATFGEIRGEIKPGEGPARFHNGLDIPGAYGETARAVRTEKVLQLLPVGDVGGVREWLRLATMGYVHVRIGRDKEGKAIALDKFQVIKGEGDTTSRVRVRRGTVINAGDAIGTLNNQNHVHLIAGPPGMEMNALAALELPGIRDTKPPVIEEQGIQLFDENWKELGDPKSDSPIVSVRGRVRIVVRAYDQMDGGADRRRLGVFQIGYEVQPNTGAFSVNGPEMNISFAELPDDPHGPALVYGPGSMSGARPPTVFAYIVTDRLTGQKVSEDFWDTTKMAPGEYVLRVTAGDFFGNRINRDVRVRVAN